MSSLEELLAANESERSRLAGDAVLAPRLVAVRAWQAARLARTYADLAAEPRYRAAVAFFLDDLYGATATGPLDQDLRRAARALERLLPRPALAVLEEAIALELRTQRLDAALAGGLADGPVTAEGYARAYRASAPRPEREAQLAAILDIGRALDRLVRHASIGALLRLARRPARAAGLGALQDFLERGFAAFGATGGAKEFLAVIGRRESELLSRLYAGDPDPFRGTDHAEL